MLIVLVGWFVALAARAFYLQGLHNDFLQAEGESRYSRVIALSAARGVMVDRNNELLAISTPVESVAASPSDMQITAEQSAKLARLLEIDVAELRRKSRSQTRVGYLIAASARAGLQGGRVNSPGVLHASTALPRPAK